MAWLKHPSSNKPSQIVIKGEYQSGKKMNSDKPSKKDFLPKGILREIERNK